ncbi:hypothetical protein M9Y10_039339 [Tritrichomonas musculus]|uniref:F5/8 type C domain-containing protein n=1 Tax=Tritrichomonas musculus TaxID=1915356 RepID=A0ABR2KBP4_9EUKA
MSKNGKIQLRTSSILRVPLHTYDKFVFIVNDLRFETSRIIADLLSNKICQIHQSDPTVDEYIINTQNKGDFSYFLKLINFNENDLPTNEIPFLIELISQLGNESYNIKLPDDPTEITNDNVFSIEKKVKKHEIFSINQEEVVNYMSLHFYELIENHREEMKNLSIGTLENVINNDKLKLLEEDQLLHFINEIYKEDRTKSFLYSYVIFKNCGDSAMKEFLNEYEIEDINVSTWRTISERLINDKSNQNVATNRYIKPAKINQEEGQKFAYSKGNEFKGILNYLRNKSNDQIEKEICITASSTSSDDLPQNVVIFENDQKYFYSRNFENSWLCFDFKDHKVIPTNYTIKSLNSNHNLKTWVIEGSNDNSEWEKIDEQNEFPGLKEYFQVCTFNISNSESKSFRYIRLLQTGKSCCDQNYLVMTSFELYGTLI